MNFDISVVCNCNSVLCYPLNKLVPSLHLVNSIALCMQHFFFVGSFLSFDKKKHWQWCCNNQSATSLVFLLSLRSTLQPSWRTSPQQGSRSRWKQKTICVLTSVAHLSFPELYIHRVCYTIFEREKDHQKRECGIMQNIVYLNLPRCYHMSLAQGSFVDSDRKRVRLSTNNKNNIIFSPSACLSL